MDVKSSIRENLVISSQFDQLPLSISVTLPENVENAKGIVQLVHGMSEHKERYFPFMDYLADVGYISIIHDHRGHGGSVRCADDLGYMYDDSGKALIEDVHQLTVYMKERFPDMPVYLFGHSMGSLIVRVYLRDFDYEISKLIVCGAPGKNPAVGLAKALIKVLKAFKGDHNVSGLMFNLSLGGFNKSVKNPRTANDWLSVNEENVDKYMADELCGFGFTLNGYSNLMNVMEMCFCDSGWKVSNPNLPILFIAGSCDPCIGGETVWNESQAFLRSKGYKNVAGKLYEGYRHEILNEDIAEDVFGDIERFIDEEYGK